MQIVAQARLRVLVQAAVLAQRLVQEPELELALGLQLEREPPLVQVQGREPARQQELAAAPESRQVRELRVYRQLEQQQHHLPAAAQEPIPYLPALPMKAPCWDAPAW